MAAELWTCPDCGHRFTTRNMWHSCTSFSLDHHFEGRAPLVRSTFDRLLEVIETFGEVTVIPQKTRIAFQAEVRFASCMTRKEWLIASLWLTRAATHPTLQRLEELGPTTFSHHFRLDSPESIDAALRDLIEESFAVGLRRHLDS